MTGTPSTPPLDPVVKTITVPESVMSTFQRFTEGIDTWWPRETHSVGAHETYAVAIEPHVGGRIYERQRDGGEATWGAITAWDPPSRVAFRWHPGRDAATAQELEVRFRQADAGTELELTHRSWEALGADAEEIRRRYMSGWEHVLDRFAEPAD